MDETSVIVALRAHKAVPIEKKALKELLHSEGQLFNLMALLWQDSEVAVENLLRYDLGNPEQRSAATQMQGIIKGRRGMILTVFNEAFKPEDEIDG